MSKLKVALFTGNYNHIKDGVSLTLNRLVRFLLSNNVDVRIYGPTVENPPMEHAGELFAVPSISAPGRDEYRVSLFFPEAMKLDLEQFKPDLIHVATPDFLGLSALKFARKRNIPLVSSYHTHFPSYLKYYNLEMLEPFLWKYLNWYYNNCQKLFVPSKSMMKWLMAKGLNSEQLCLWTRGVETDLFNPSKRDDAYRKSLGFSEEEVVISFVSRIVWEKDVRTVIDTCRILLKLNPKVKFLIGGDGPAKQAMQKELPEAVYVGYLVGESLAKLYASSDIFLFPSDTETFGNVTLEAMACGVPAVVSDSVGGNSIVLNGETGYITTPRNPGAFAKCLFTLCSDHDLRKKMSKNARERAQSFEWDAIMNGLLSDYHKVVGNHKLLH